MRSSATSPAPVSRQGSSSPAASSRASRDASQTPAGSSNMRELEAACDGELGVTELSAGDPAAALPWLLRSDAILAELGQHALRSTTQALVAQTQELLDNRAAARA